MLMRRIVVGFRPFVLRCRFASVNGPPSMAKVKEQSKLPDVKAHNSKATGTKLKIIVHFGKKIDKVELLDTSNLIYLRKAIKAAFPEGLAKCDASGIVVRTKDTAGEFRFLENHTSNLADELGENGKFEVYVSPKTSGKLEWDPLFAKFTVAQLPLPLLETEPHFIAPAGWLEEMTTAVQEECMNADSDARRTRPLCVARCSRGGKTRALKEVAHRLHKSMSVIFVTFNNYSNLDKFSDEQDDPLQALLIRIAFVATHAVADRTNTNFSTFREKYHVSMENIQAWLGDTPCVLIIDEMNCATKLQTLCEEGADFVSFLRANFLAPSGRIFVFSSHVVTTVGKLNDYLQADISRRHVLVKPLPKITSLAIARQLAPSIMIQELLYHGLMPALIVTHKHTPPSWNVKEEFKIDENGVRELFRSFFTGDPHFIHKDLLRFMDTVAQDKVLWIMSYMQVVLDQLSPRFYGTIMQHQLSELSRLIGLFVDFKAREGDGFEILLAFTFLLRAGCGSPCTWSELKPIIVAPEGVPFPHVSYIQPTHASFQKYDGFALIYDEAGKLHCTLAFQLKCRKENPQGDADEADLKSFLVRGHALDKEIGGWRVVSNAELIDFFGVSGASWVPERLDALLAP